MHARRSFLFHNCQPWVKVNNPNHDVTMGSYDGAEICDLVGLFLLSKLQHLNIDLGLYRDDGLGISSSSPRQIDVIKKKIKQIFNEQDLTITIDANQKIFHFLDVTFNLNNDTYKPFTKPNDRPLYVNKKSNHPPRILENIGPSVNKRLSTISKNEQVFNETKEPFQQALHESGHDFQLKFEPQGQIKRKNRSRAKIWFNPPYSMNVETKIGSKFLKLIDKHFPKDSKFHKLFNRNTIKLSYRCMPNFNSVISKHNSKVLKKHSDPDEQNETPPCKCRKGPCPVDGLCESKNVIYQATVMSEGKVESYTGRTATSFKQRHANHKCDFNLRKRSNNTAVSKHVWALKDQNKPFTISYKFLKKSHPFNPISGKCMLCLDEKYLILFNPEGATLNLRTEFFSHCPHKEYFVLDNT